MKEATFIRRNIDRWKQQEGLVEQADSRNADELADAYTELTADLAFAQSHYPKSRITLYLNNLASALHVSIYGHKRERRGRVIDYWLREVPLVMWEARKLLLASFLIFAVSVLIGVISTLGDESFPRLILGDGYIDMTLDNIERGDPMGVYKSENSLLMFLAIVFNNVQVAFLCFASGLFSSLGSGFILFRNGVMVGAFQTFFFQHDLLLESSLAIWLHGTLEMMSVVVAGAAGLCLGNGLLFPGCRRRIDAFRIGARRGMKIVIGTVPLFIFAGFIEGFVTRYTGLPNVFRAGFIVMSLAFGLWYFVWLPWRRAHEQDEQTNELV